LGFLLPFSIAQQYESNKVKAAYAVFGKSYEYREAYKQFKKTGWQGNVKKARFIKMCKIFC